jgi:hypothetical protein
VDRDRARPRERLAELQEARERDRHDAKLAVIAIALGEADPHGEAWLLDDRHAVRVVLRLDAEDGLPRVRDVSSPNDVLDRLVKQCPRSGEPARILLQVIAQRVQASPCLHGAGTGFEQFIQEIKIELEPLARTQGDRRSG